MNRLITDEELVKETILAGNRISQEKKIRSDFKEEQNEMDHMSENEKEKHFRDLANGK